MRTILHAAVLTLGGSMVLVGGCAGSHDNSHGQAMKTCKAGCCNLIVDGDFEYRHDSGALTHAPFREDAPDADKNLHFDDTLWYFPRHGDPTLDAYLMANNGGFFPPAHPGHENVFAWYGVITTTNNSKAADLSQHVVPHLKKGTKYELSFLQGAFAAEAFGVTGGFVHVQIIKDAGGTVPGTDQTYRMKNGDPWAHRSITFTSMEDQSVSIVFLSESGPSASAIDDVVLCEK